MSESGSGQTVRTKIAEINEAGEREIERIEAELDPTNLEIARDPPQESGPILMAQLDASITDTTGGQRDV